MQYAVPDMLLAIAIIAAFGANTVNLILALSIGMVAVYARTVRATVLGLANAEFVEAARSCGARDWNIIFRHIIPNSLAPIIVRSTMGIGTAVLSTSSLSYLGLGVEPHIPEWGNILKIGSQYLELSLIHISEPTRQAEISYAVFCLKKKKKKQQKQKRE